MPFDPSYPPANAEILSAPLRDQFTSLKDLIDTVPTLNAAQVDGVTPLPPGSMPAASVSVSGNTLHFTFALPQGIDSVTSVAPTDPALANTRWESWLQISRREGYFELWSGTVAALLEQADAARAKKAATN